MKAIDVANWFVVKANSENLGNDTSEGISNLKLQKMLYFAQAAHLALGNNTPLFDDEISAWEFGPVVEAVYQNFKSSKNQPIAKPTDENYKNFNDETVGFLENVWSIFGKFSAAKLVQMSHEHKPWIEAYKSDNKTISKQKIFDYYKTAFKQV